MKLNIETLKDTAWWSGRGYTLPGFDIAAMRENTIKNPRWIHFGAGNIFRAFPAKGAQALLDSGETDFGIIAAEGYDKELSEKIFRPYDNLTLLAEFRGNGEIKKSVIGSIAEAITADSSDKAQFERLKEIFRADTLQLVSFTITEKGYKLRGSDGKLLPSAEKDFACGVSAPESPIGKVAALLYERFLCGAKPLALVSMDNCSDNGGTLFRAVTAYSEEWTKRGLVKDGFDEYVKSDKVSFPITMIDKITPRPDASVEKMLLSDGVEDISPLTTAFGTYAAAFVNAEEIGYLVIEDKFPNGRPPFEKCGFYMTDKETVRRTEKMKVCTCLNPLHTALAVFGCLLGHKLICEEMKDPLLSALVNKIGYEEGLPSASEGSIIKPRDFLSEVINERLPNPYLPDAPQRIATDTSMKLSVRFGETLKYYAAKDSIASLKYIPLVIAGWLRYLMSVNDKGEPFERSSDPFLSDERAEYMRSLTLGGEYSEDKLREILSDEGIFGIDLCGTPAEEKILGCFHAMSAGAGAVESTLKSALM